MIGKSLRSRCWRALRWAGLAAAAPALWACTSRTLEAPTITPTATLTSTVTQKINNNVDILFMIDNSSSMTSMQQKLAMQLPAFMQVLEGLPNGLPNVHIAVVSSDMGAPGDSTNQIGCTPSGDGGNFQYNIGAAGMCNATTLDPGATFISDVDGQKNFTDPIESVFECIAQLGAAGCGFEHQLASIDRALGADGQGGPPSGNANFLRPDAYLGIVLLTNEDDCSAPPNTTIFSLNGGMQSITNPDGPIANYRCNGGPRGAHLCKDPSGNMIVPPLNPPANASGSPPILNLTDCEDNEASGNQNALTSVTQFVKDIKSLKTDPDNQILVAAITAPPDPYGVVWVPPSSPPPGTSGQVWPQVMHSCGAEGGDDVNPMATAHPTDGSFGDPGVRITQFVHAFPNSVVASICDASYRNSMTAIATKLGALIKPNCITGTIQTDSNNQPACVVTNHLTDGQGNTMDVVVQNCAENGNAPPCWSLGTDATACPGGGYALKVSADSASMNAASLNSTVECSLCVAGSGTPGCP
ncbi:MAG TPA: vWA domain-containing protein [Polyangia bacterium]|nr:vWA domain-containing protein [Polyangia bacterium]